MTPRKFHAEPFTMSVLRIVADIPAGTTLAYRDVARRAGKPRAWRAVGNILAGNYDPSVPCHRVVRSDGALGGYNRGKVTKRRLLTNEHANLRKPSPA